MASSLRKRYENARQYGFFWVTGRLSARARALLSLPVRVLRKKRAIRAAAVASRRPRREKEVVFICERLHVRAVKMAFALKGIGWRVTLLHKEPLSFDVSEYFDKTRRFENPWEALSIAAEYSPVAYHVFTLWNFELASTLIRHKPGKIVFDYYDVLTGMVKSNLIALYAGQSELEQYCYRNADGLCCRDLRVQYLKRELGLKLPPRILFPEYCWPERKFKRSKKLSGGVHVVYVGSIEPDPDSPVAYHYGLAALLSGRRIHYHIYPSYAHVGEELKSRMAKFVTGTADKDYVHIHDTISPLGMRQELSRYHYGVLISGKNVEYGEDHDTYLPHQADYLLTSKVFDYLDAGLVTLTQDARMTRCLLERCNAGIVVRSLEEIVQVAAGAPPPEVNVVRSLFIEANADRLATFYQAL
jgi:hypothetical protein